MNHQIGTTTDDGRFHFSRITPRSYDVADGDVRLGHVWAEAPRVWFCREIRTMAFRKRGPFLTRLAAARALVETMEGT